MGGQDTRVAQFDGVRALAIFLVVLSHLFERTVGGFVGVDIFFVLSGYLITDHLRKEWSASGTIRLSHFYARRALRLCPALAVVLLFCIGVLAVSGHPRDHAKDVAAAAFYVMNWYRLLAQQDGWALGHTWSLAVEEQFYLFWPVIFILAARFGKAGLIAAASALLLISAAFGFAYGMAGFDFSRIYQGFDTRALQLFVGCLIGLINIPVAVAKQAARLWFVPILFFASLTVLAIPGQNTDWLAFGGYLLIAIVAGWLILAAPHEGALGAIFKLDPLVFLGRISYGIYLWHGPFIYFSGPHAMAKVAAVFASIAVAALSFEFLERPVLRYSHRRFGVSRHELSHVSTPNPISPHPLAGWSSPRAI